MEEMDHGMSGSLGTKLPLISKMTANNNILFHISKI